MELWRALGRLLDCVFVLVGLGFLLTHCFQHSFRLVYLVYPLGAAVLNKCICFTRDTSPALPCYNAKETLYLVI